MNRIFISAFLLSGCALKDYPSTDTGDAVFPDSFTGGLFQMTSQGVSDFCGDGAFSSLLMPEGDGTPTDWEYPIEIPSWGTMETRVNYTIQLQDPFSEMQVTVVQGDPSGEIKMSGGSQDDIPLFDDDSCFVDLGISATLQIVDNNNLTGQATLVFNDSSGLGCTFAKDCEMKLDFTAKRTTE